MRKMVGGARGQFWAPPSAAIIGVGGGIYGIEAAHSQT